MNINILLDNVEFIGEGAIALLLSVINDCNANGALVKGTKPKKEQPNSRKIAEVTSVWEPL